MASQHGALEMVLMEEGPEAEKLMERLMEHEGKKNSSIIKTEDELEATLSENVLLVKEENKLQELSPGFSDSLLVCRFDECKSVRFKSDNKREIKLHYATKHFADYFIFNSETGVPENFTKIGNRTRCDKCSGNARKPVYIQSDMEAIRGHLVVKHDIMNEILLEAHEKQVTQAKQALEDIYPTLYSDKFGSE